MTKTIPGLAAAAAALALAGAAEAQPRGGGSATLYELPNFQGRSVTITGSAPDLGDWRFNDRAQSVQLRGRWRLCEHDDFRGRCQEVSGDIPNLHTYGLMAQVSSMEPTGFVRPGPGPGSGRPGGGWGGPRERGVEGTRTVFFARPAATSTPSPSAAIRAWAPRSGSTPASAPPPPSAPTARSPAAPR